MATAPWTTEVPTALLVLADGTVIEGRGVGAAGTAVGEVCFNTALTGYEEILTDPSYAGQIVTFTFPHIGNVGTNDEDGEDLNPAARNGAVGAIFKADVTSPSSYRAAGHLDDWLKRRGVVALSGIDTRALTALIREKGAANAVIAHAPDGRFDIEDLKRQAAGWSGLVGLDLAKEVTSGQSSVWTETPWVWNEGYGEQAEPTMHIVAVDYGVKRSLLRLLAGLGARVTVVPARMAAEDILAMKPDGVFLSNGPGDPAATGGEALSGTLGFYDNQVDQATGTVLVKAEFDNGGGLLWPGQTVNVTTRFRPEGELVVVPTVAVRPGPSGDFVYTVDADKHVHVTPVEVARANGDRSGIAKGLKAGDEVIVEGQSQLTDGQAVNPSQEDAADKVAEATGVQGAQP